MKINTGGNWPFFCAYNDNRYILSHDERKIVVLREPKESREYRLENKSGKELVVYQIDGGIIICNNVLKCDFGVFTEDNILFLVELKGADYIHALEQIITTIGLLLVRPAIKVGRLNARIVLSKVCVPAIMPSQEKKLLAIVKSKGGNLIKQSRVLKEII